VYIMTRQEQLPTDLPLGQRNVTYWPRLFPNICIAYSSSICWSCFTTTVFNL